MCCENCPVVFHAECHGYKNLDEAPDDWECFACAGKLVMPAKLKPLKLRIITVNHASAQELIPQIQHLISDRGNVQFDKRTNSVIIKDVEDQLAAMEDLIRRLDTQTPQVLIEARIVEVNDVNELELGIQWGLDSIFSAATGNPTGLRFPSSIGVSGGRS